MTQLYHVKRYLLEELPLQEALSQPQVGVYTLEGLLDYVNKSSDITLGVYPVQLDTLTFSGYPLSIRKSEGKIMAGFKTVTLTLDQLRSRIVTANASLDYESDDDDDSDDDSDPLHLQSRVHLGRQLILNKHFSQREYN